MERQKIAIEEIESQKTENGGWTRDVLAKWGVSWPPPKGWKADLLINGIIIQGRGGPSNSASWDETCG